ncbi:hypothetical protein CERSUDRAFT_112035 [Gelatoporia subvermispora B]|uniref:CRAL-TRIO domain-containing protein n=1 Tax=Ceriporiopsis subvermispora (strain B) TaxID=914234 RepID=M2RMP6_CERS8|nr:hypothetical protein CERSUDRAFT_112035 [Gelatoporia subvermispora B]
MSGDGPSTGIPDAGVDVFAGHLGHLSPDQDRAFAAFKKALTDAGLYTPPIERDGAVEKPASHDDITLLRFLRARRFDPPKAVKQFSDTEAWRRQHDVEALYASFPSDEFELSRRFYPRWTGRRDRNGRPVYVYRLASLQGELVKELGTVPAERRYQRIVALYELMVRFVLPLCSALPHAEQDTPISDVTTIIDLSAVSLGTLWTLRSHLGEASTLAKAHYPETLGTIAVLHAPSFFPTVWGWIKGWFDPGTRAKIHIVAADPSGRAPAELTALIAPSDLPQPYGGELPWRFEDPPALDEQAAAALGGQLPRGPVEWVGRVKRLGEAETVNGTGGEGEQKNT